MDRSGYVMNGSGLRSTRMKDKKSRHDDPMNPSERIDQLIPGLTDWRGQTLASVRKSILEAHREIIEQWKWKGRPGSSHARRIPGGHAHNHQPKLHSSP